MRAIGVSLHHHLPRLSSKSVNWRSQKLNGRSTTAAAADSDSDEQWHGAGRMVDKSMPVLRKRLKEIKALDRGTGQYSMELLELEDGYCHTFFSSEMLELLGLLKLQSSSSEDECLPKLLIGFSVMLTVNLPVPVLVAVLHLKDAMEQREEGNGLHKKEAYYEETICGKEGIDTRTSGFIATTVTACLSELERRAIRFVGDGGHLLVELKEMARPRRWVAPGSVP